MATYIWTGATNTSWSLAANWSPAGLPTISDDVIFTNSLPGINNPCTVTVQSNCRSLTIGSGYNSTITLNNSIVVGAVTGSGLPPIPLYTSYTAVTIDGSPTFIYNPNATTPGCIQVTNNVSTAVVGISSSTSTTVPLRIANGQDNGGNFFSTVIFSGSILTSYLDIAHIGVTQYWGGANGSQIILSGSTSSPGIIRNSAAITNLAPTSSGNPTYVPPFICSGSISWRFGGGFVFPLFIASQSIFQYTGSSNPNTAVYNTSGGGIDFSNGGKTFYTTANPLNIHVHPSASLLCTTSSFLGFNGVNAAVHMSGSTTNKWNGLRLVSSTLQITSDLWLEQNQNLVPSNIVNTTNRPFGIGTLAWGGINSILNSAGRTIYIGGNLAGGNNQSINTTSTNGYLAYPSGPRLLMYGAGYVGSPYPGLAIVGGNTNTANIDLEISSSKAIAWGTPNDPTHAINNLSGRIIYTTASSWTPYVNTFRPSSGIIDLKGNPVWNMGVGFNTIINTFSSSIACSGSLIVGSNATLINSSSLTNPTISVLQNIVSTQSVQGGVPQANIGNIAGGTVPIQMIGNLPATYSLSIFPSPVTNPCPDITINKPKGSVLIKNIVSSSAGTPPILWERPLNYGNGTFTYLAGTIDTGTSTMQLHPSASMNTAGNSIPWYNITVSGSGTGTARGSLIDIISPLVITNELNLGVAGNVAFTGSDTWTCSRLVCTTPGRRIILQDALSTAVIGRITTQKEYRTTNFVNLSSNNAASPIIISSSATPTTRASWSVSFNAPNANVFNVSGASIDSSNGRTIWTTGGISNTVNWNLGTLPASSFYTFFID
jgi:hypothetical protein